MQKLFKALLFFIVFLSFFLINKAFAEEASKNVPPIRYLINDEEVQQEPELWQDREKAQTGEGPLRIDGLDTSVKVTFRGTGIKTGPYYLCGRLNPKECDKKSRLWKFSVQSEDEGGGGQISINACAAGPDSLKGKAVSGGDNLNSKDGCSKEDDWFHEGKVYRMHLFQDENGEALLATAQFYVVHSYPVIKIAPKNAAKASSETPLQVFLWGRRPGGNDENNYNVKLKGDNGNTEIERCAVDGKGEIIPPVSGQETVGINTQGIDLDQGTIIQEHFSEGSGWGDIGPLSESSAAATTLGKGKKFDLGIGTQQDHFTLEINERVHDSRPLGALRGSCNGGYTYMRIQFQLDEKAQNGIRIISVEYDPDDLNNADSEKMNKFYSAPQPPCALRDEFNSKKCVAVNTAIGTINTTIDGFVNSIFRLVLMLAGFGGIIIMIYSGYLIMASRGDKEKIAAARETITSAILGLLFIIFSIVILEIIGVDVLRIPGLSR